MSKHISPPSPERFGLTTFADLLPARDPIPGEDPGSFKGFREGMMWSLTPFTPYECVVAENLVAIEWELLQHRRMRDAALRRTICVAIRDAVVARERARHYAALRAAWQEFIDKGGDEDDWEDPFDFDEGAAREIGDDLGARAVSADPDVQAEACAEIVALGIAPVELMSKAYAELGAPASRHDEKIQELERRRREVKRDYDALQKVRPLEAEVIDG